MRSFEALDRIFSKSKMMADLPELPLPLGQMSRKDLVTHINTMIKVSEKRDKMEYGKLNFRPIWWPKNLPWENVRYDARFGTDGPQGTWIKVLKDLISKCYRYFEREDLLYNHCISSGKTHSSTCEMKHMVGASPTCCAREDVESDDKDQEVPFSSFYDPRTIKPKEVPQKDFMAALGLEKTSKRTNRSNSVRLKDSVFCSQSYPHSPPHSPRTLISQLSREFSPHRYRYEHGHVVSLEEDPADDEDDKSAFSVEFSSILGQELHPMMEKQAPRFTRCTAETVGEYCLTPKKSDMVLKLRHQGECNYPTTYKKNKKTAYRWCHTYKFNKADHREWWITIHSGLNRKTRALRARLPACRIILDSMRDSDIQTAKEKVREDHRRLMIRKQQEQQRILQQKIIQQQLLQQQQQRSNVFPVFISQNSMFHQNFLSNSMRHSSSSITLTPPTTPERISPVHGVNEADPIVIDEDDDVVCLGPKPTPSRLPPQRMPAAPRQETLLFKCHLCGSEISCRGEFGRRVEDHYSVAHKLHHIRLVRHQDAAGQMVVSIVEQRPQQRPQQQPVVPIRPKPDSSLLLNRSNTDRAKNQAKNISRPKPFKRNLSNQLAVPGTSSADVICLD